MPYEVYRKIFLIYFLISVVLRRWTIYLVFSVSSYLISNRDWIKSEGYIQVIRRSQYHFTSILILHRLEYVNQIVSGKLVDESASTKLWSNGCLCRYFYHLYDLYINRTPSASWNKWIIPTSFKKVNFSSKTTNSTIQLYKSCCCQASLTICFVMSSVRIVLLGIKWITYSNLSSCGYTLVKLRFLQITIIKAFIQARNIALQILLLQIISIISSNILTIYFSAF